MLSCLLVVGRHSLVLTELKQRGVVFRGGNGRNVSMRRLDSRLIHDGEDSGTLSMTYRPIFFVKKLVGQLTVLNQELLPTAFDNITV